MLISNPLTNELLVPLAITFGSLLSLGLLGVILAVLQSKDKALNAQLLKRWSSWALIAPITVFSVLSGPFVFSIMAAIISVVCTMEFCSITGRSQNQRIVLAVVSAILPIIACLSAPGIAPILVFAAMLLVFFSMKDARNFESNCVSLIALFYVPLLSSHAVLLDKIPGIGSSLLISIISASALANIIAFVFGKLIGGPKLAASISPNKTWSGVAGSVVGSYIGFFILSQVLGLQVDMPLKLALPLVVAAIGVIGDLFESQLKRSFEVKDAGSWLPGFGGALDRVDGLLFILPCVYYLVIQTI